MPWWSWLIIWAGLGLALLAMFALFAIAFFRKAVAIGIALQRLAGLSEVLGRTGDQLDESRADNAILQGRAELERRRAIVRAASLARRDRRHEARLSRARALLAVDASERSWFVTPTGDKER